MKFKLSIFLIQLIIFSGCREKDVRNPQEAYSYWIKSDMNSKVEVVNGKYWESSHFLHEYIIYLELKVDSDQGSMYFYNEKTQSVFIYEIQL